MFYEVYMQNVDLMNSVQKINELKQVVLESSEEIQKQHILLDSPYSQAINEYISNYNEFYIYYTLKLKEAVVTRPSLIKDVDLDLWITSKNKTNKELMLSGNSPYAYDDEDGVIEIHHIGQNYDAPFAELTAKEHLMYGNNKVFHVKDGESWRKDKRLSDAFKKERKKYWKMRAKKEYSINDDYSFKNTISNSFQLPEVVRAEIKEVIETLFNECTSSDLEYLADLANTYSLVKQTGAKNFSEFIFKTRNDIENSIQCSYCKSDDYELYGKYSTTYENVQRYKCKKCGKIYTATNKSLISGSTLSYMNWVKFIDCLYNGFSLETTARICGITVQTALNNRIKLFYALKLLDDNLTLRGNVVIDETYYPVSFKGNHSDENFILPRKAHRRGHDNHKKGLSREHVCIVCALDDSGISVAHISGCGAPKGRDLTQVLKNHINKENVVRIYTDKSAALTTYARNTEIEHKQTISPANKRKRKVSSGSYTALRYLQKINSYHSRLKKFLMKFNGVSTKNLAGYLYLFSWKERNKERNPIEAYKELLSVMTSPNLYVSVEEIKQNGYLPDALTINFKKSAPKFKDEERAREMHRRYLSGESMASIGRDFGCSRQWVQYTIDKFRKAGLSEKPKNFEKKEQLALEHEIEKEKRKFKKYEQRYYRDLRIYNYHESFLGSEDEFYENSIRMFRLSKNSIKGAITRTQHRIKLAESLSITDSFSYKTLEEIYREIFSEYLLLREENPTASKQSCYDKLAEKHGYLPGNILRIITIMETEEETKYFNKKRRLSKEERIERDKMIYIEYLKYPGSRHEFCLLAAEKYDLSHYYIHEIIYDVILANSERYEIG